MIASELQALVQADIPDTCDMYGGFTKDADLRFVFGEPDKGLQVVFERPALERFVHLAVDLLSTPLGEDPPPPRRGQR